HPGHDILIIGRDDIEGYLFSLRHGQQDVELLRGKTYVELPYKLEYLIAFSRQYILRRIRSRIRDQYKVFDSRNSIAFTHHLVIPAHEFIGIIKVFRKMTGVELYLLAVLLIDHGDHRAVRNGTRRHLHLLQHIVMHLIRETI